MGGIELHAGILAHWFAILLLLPFLKIRYYGRQWGFILCNDTLKTKMAHNVFDHYIFLCSNLLIDITSLHIISGIKRDVVHVASSS